MDKALFDTLEIPSIAKHTIVCDAEVIALSYYNNLINKTTYNTYNIMTF